MSFLHPICEGTSKSLANSIAFAFLLIGIMSNPFAAFTFAFAPMEALQYVYVIFHSISHSHLHAA